ncbi:hypothetical protein HUV48_09220 [Altererythrobacter sp. HHU K3-1]|uniref:ScoMcrA-like N-terminal head domain-containing protein n=1 Tax=Qipengyuania atrilutea TaxID=2744473 RepID=A0A850HDG3_9SPHN|nr:hypothetical protein [Actirhodobacter atriluteus]
MTENEFKKWMAGEGLALSSISTRISDLRRVERHFGDLDTAYDKDGCATIFEKLSYTAADQTAGKPNPSGIEIEGSLYEGLSGYKSSLAAYVRFRNSETEGSDTGILTRAAVLAAIRECKELGTGTFLNKHKFRRPRTYWIAENETFYPCKAIANVALRAVEGADTQIRDATRSRELISRLGFRVVDSLDERLDPAEFERLKQRFLSKFSDFERLGFGASEGGYFDEERGYKDALLEKDRRRWKIVPCPNKN